MMKVAIATTSSEKIKGIIKGFSQFFQMEESKIEVYSQKTPSGVSEQPFDFEIYKGARNRVESLKKNFSADFYISCEAGIEGFEDLYFNVQVVCIYEVATEKFIWGKSSGWQIDAEDIEIIKECNLDSYLRNKGIQNIEELLSSEFSRSESVFQATKLALLSKRL